MSLSFMSFETPDKKTSQRIKPCLRCKTQRRKCDRSSDAVRCSRCIKSNRVCTSDVNMVAIEDDTVDGNPDLRYLTTQVVYLQAGLRQMESQLHWRRSLGNATNLIASQEYKTGTTLDPALEHHNLTTVVQNAAYSFLVDSNLQWSMSSSLQHSTSTSDSLELSSNTWTSNTNSSQASGVVGGDSEYQWDLTLVDGKLRLESTIQGIAELMAYGHALQRYLSPFAGVFENTSFLFETTQPQSLLPTVIQVVSRRPVIRRGGNFLTRGAMLTKYNFLLQRHHPAVLLAAAGEPPPISCIDDLMRTYFSCFNPALPLIHAPSYLAEYETVIRSNYLQHALTLSICSMICSSTCRHLVYNNYERRILADYFYEKAIDLLDDFFDDPDRRLETLMVINCLTQYQEMTLRVKDARKWSTIAYMIAQDLRQEHNLNRRAPPSPSTDSTSQDSTYTIKDRDVALITRHYVMTLYTQKFLSFILDHETATWEFTNAYPLLYLEDECELSYVYIGAYNHILQVACHPVILDFREQTRRMHLGQKAKVTLELILRVEQVFKDWWSSLPPHLRLCHQYPSDITCRPAIQQCTNQAQLIVAVVALSNKAESNLTLAKPSNQSDISQGGDYELVRAIQERALNEAFECSESIRLALGNLESRRDYCIFSSELLLSLSDILCTLAGSSSMAVKGQAKLKLTDSIHDLRRANFMEGNLVPPSLSPLAYMDKSASMSASSHDLVPNILEMYDEYAHPCLAFGYDILRKASLD